MKIKPAQPTFSIIGFDKKGVYTSYPFINPSSFTFFESALILAIVVLGGIGSILGVVIAALTVTMLPEVLRDFADYRILVFGILMVLIMILKPRGLISQKRKQYQVEAT